MSRGRTIRRFAFAAFAVALATGTLAETADAGIYRKARNIYDPVFADIRVCRDGIEFVLGSETGEPDRPVDDVGNPEGVTLVRADGSVVLHRSPALFPAVAPPYSIFFPEILEGNSTKVFAVRVIMPWTVAGRPVKLRVGETISGSFGEALGEPMLFATGAPGDPSLVVQRGCKVLKPGKAKVDVRPGVNPNPVTPGSSAPVPFAVLSKPGLDASVIDPATVRIQGAPTTGGSVSDVDGDGDQDFVASFSPAAAGIACGTKRLDVTATTKYGGSIKGKGRVSTTC